jgi:hypothetical protein
MKRFFRRLLWMWYEYKNGRGSWFKRCEHCKLFRWCRYTPSMTMYEDDSLNFNGHLCASCKQEYQEYWQERWDEYNSGRL